jgi:uncharacterized cupin superfamily protein
MAMTPFNLAHRDDFERTGDWLLARRTLGVESFGVNLVDIPPGGTIPEHDELDRAQEELFVVLSGEGVFVVDGQELPATTGTYLRLDPEPKRTARNTGTTPLQLLIISAPKSSGYTPMNWA